MKKLLFLFMTTLFLFACSNNTEKKDMEVAKVEKEDFSVYKFTDHDLLKSYIISGEEIVFKIDMDFSKERILASMPESSEINSISLTGSFTGWKDRADMKMTKQGNAWYLKKKLSELMIPGNSGYPEFAFYIEGNYLKKGRKRPTEAYIKPSSELELGYKFSDQFTGENNYLIVGDGVDLEKIKQDHLKAITIKKEYESKEDMTNFRNVKTGKIKEGRLYRSYHPFIPSKDYDKEIDRNAEVEKLLEENHIKSIINLTDGEEIYSDERVPEYYKDLIDNGNVLLEKTKYRIVYYESNSENFANTLKKVSEFIIEKDTPYLVHCRLGTDRTGVTTAFIEALMGASWDEIVNDYQRSNRVGMEEFRHANLLRYSFKNALGIDPVDNENLTETTKEFFINKVGLSENEIEKIYEKLAM